MKASASVSLTLLLGVACGRSAPPPVVGPPTPAVAASPAAGPSPTTTPSASTGADASLRQHAPQAGPPKPFAVPVVEQAHLRNGLPVVFAQWPSPFVTVYVLARGGLADVGPDQVEVLGQMTATMLGGTKSKTVWALDDEYVSLYMPRPSVPWWADTVALKLVAPAGSIPEVAKLAADFVLHPSFDQKEFERTRDIDAVAYERAADNGSVLAPAALRRTLFGAHPYAGVEGSAARRRTVTRAQVLALHARVFDPGRLTIVVAGGVEEKATVDALEDAFGALPARSRSRGGVAPPAPRPSGPRLVVVDLPGAAIANIAMGVVGPPAGASDAEAAMVAMEVLADGGMGRLPVRLRDELGAVPWVSLSAYEASVGGILGWNTRAPTERVANVITEAARVVEQLIAQGPSDAELVWARDREVKSLASSFETSASAAYVLAWAVATGQPAESVAQRPQRFAQVTSAAAKDAAARYLEVGRLRAVVAGDWATLREPLSALGWGPIEVRKADGTLVSPEGPRNATR